MPKALPKEFRDNAVAMARAGDIPVGQLAKELGISESGLRRWMAQADIEEGARPGVTRTESRLSWRGCVAGTGCSSKRSRY